MKYFSRVTASLFLLSAGSLLQAQFPTTPKTTEVMVLVTAKPGIERDQLVKLAPEEVRATVRLYLDGKIRQWYSRSDGRGVILIVDAKNVAEAKAIVDEIESILADRPPLELR